MPAQIEAGAGASSSGTRTDMAPPRHIRIALDSYPPMQQNENGTKDSSHMHFRLERNQETNQNAIHVSTTALKPRGGIRT